MGQNSTSAEQVMRAVVAAPADHPADISALANMPDRPKLAAEPTARTKPEAEADRRGAVERY
ncbi:hypothetical protein [Leucobacter denitrificans]|uniref:Uncharacterized protein n=1 Tax=Leucobacter denitrificans TaxID=683042 RepID=A0A7G9S878_9MICO|nr:hypothetical protein [Leucobacter denitrificans]QNN64053.1 hypothetical protein H9L06_02610 [Leucobacter denitrificans]